jgi:hypothetical protein
MKKLSPEITIKLGGADRTIRFDFNLLVEAEEYLNFDKRKGDEKALDDPSRVSAWDGTLFAPLTSKKIVTLLWAGLLHDEEKLEIKEVGYWLSIDKVKELSGIFKEVAAEFAELASGLVGETKEKTENKTSSKA